MKKAFEKEQTVSWHSSEWSILRGFWKDIESETTHARDRFNFPGCHLENDIHTRSYWLSIIEEEIGKLCQCNNKLQIAEDNRVRAEWMVEGYHRIITSVSLLRRLAENWDKLP